MCGLCVRRAVQYVSYILIFYANSPLMISHILYSYQPTRWYGILYPGWPHTKNIWCHNLCQAPCSIPYLVPTLTLSLTSSHFLPCPIPNLFPNIPYLVPSLFLILSLLPFPIPYLIQSGLHGPKRDRDRCFIWFQPPTHLSPPSITFWSLLSSIFCPNWFNVSKYTLPIHYLSWTFNPSLTFTLELDS